MKQFAIPVVVPACLLFSCAPKVQFTAGSLTSHTTSIFVLNKQGTSSLVWSSNSEPEEIDSDINMLPWPIKDSVFLPDKTEHYFILIFWKGILTFQDSLEQPGKISAENFHGLQAFDILDCVAGSCSIDNVPVIGTGHEHLSVIDEIIQLIIGRDSACPAVCHNAGSDLMPK